VTDGTSIVLKPRHRRPRIGRAGRATGRSRRWTRLAIALAGLALETGCSLLFPTEAGETLSHFREQAPAEGAPAPAVNARALDGRPVELTDIVGDRPVVLQLGSHSCPVYRYRRFDMAALQREFDDRVDFVVVYTQEAHPVGTQSPYADEEWLTFANWLTWTRIDQPETMAQRLERARWSRRALERDDRVIVDVMDNTTWRNYGAAPSAAFVLDAQGHVVLRQPWVEPDGIRRALRQLL